MFERKFQHLQPQQTPAPAPVPEVPDTFGDSTDTKRPLDPHRELMDEQDREQRITFRLKSAAGAGFVMLILYALISLPGKVDRSPEQISSRDLTEQEEFEALRARHDTDRVKKQGFFQKIFCGSHQRSTFCDGAE